MSWPSFGLGFAAAWAWLIAAIGLGVVVGRRLRTQAPAPAADPPRAPGPGPGLEPRLLMSSRFYSDGVVYVDDHIKRTTRRFDPPPGDDLEVSDAEIERWLRDGA